MRKKTRWYSVIGLSFVGMVGFAGCSGNKYSATPAGAEGGKCFPNGTCDTGLACKSNLCVNLGAADGGLHGTGGNAGVGADGKSGESAGGSGGQSVGGAGGSGTAGAGGLAGSMNGGAGQGGSAGMGGVAGQTSDGGVPSGGKSGIDAGIHIPIPDASTGNNDGGSTSADGGTCDVESDYGSLSDLGGTAQSGTLPDYTQYAGDLPPTDVPSQLHLQLYSGYGVFASGITTLDNFTLSGDELNYETCGVCALIFSNFNGATYDRVYFLTAGSITLTSVTGNMTGTLNNATFEEVTVDPGTFHSTPVPGGCMTAITSVPFDATIVAQ